MLNSVGGLTRKRYLRRVEPLVNTLLHVEIKMKTIVRKTLMIKKRLGSIFSGVGVGEANVLDPLPASQDQIPDFIISVNIVMRRSLA